MTFQQHDNNILIQLHVPRDNDSRQAPPKVIFVVDASGSMQTEWPNVTRALTYIGEAAQRVDPLFIRYGDSAELMDRNRLSAIGSNGMTNFHAAISLLTTSIQTFDATSNVVVVFLTDGSNTVSPGPDVPMAKLREYAKQRQGSITIHCVGFGRWADQKFLTLLCQCGADGGAVRNAATGDALDEQMGELLDFADRLQEFSVGFREQKVVVEGVLAENGETYAIETMVKLEGVDGLDIIDVVVNDTTVQLTRAATDIFFDMAVVEAKAARATTEKDVLATMKHMGGINPSKARRDLREAAWQRKAAVQAKLDLMLAALAQRARKGMAAGGGAAAQLDALRYNDKLAKTRRRRLADRRATTNATRFRKLSEQESVVLTDEELADIATMERIGDTRCALSGDSVEEILRDSDSDFLVFSLNVTRAECAIDAPSTLRVDDVVVGVFSFEAFVHAQRYALSVDANAHESGYFKAADGRRMNCALPLFLSNAHWRRAARSVPAVLGHAFALDALSFHENMYMALFAVLGQLEAAHARGDDDATSDWHAFVRSQLAQVCAAVRTPLHRWMFAGQWCGGAVREDLLTAFLNGNMRVRMQDALGSLMVLVGMAAVERNPALQQLAVDVGDVKDGGAGDALTGRDLTLPAVQTLDVQQVPGVAPLRSTRTALALVVPANVAATIDAIRKQHDPAFSRWPAHANLLFPFLSDSDAVDPRILGALHDALAKTGRFHVTLSRFALFAKSRTLYLRVDTSPKGALTAIQKAVAAMFPHCVRPGVFEAHVTVARGDLAELDVLKQELERSFKGVHFDCDGLSVLTRGEQTPFTEHTFCRFSTVSAEATESAPAATTSLDEGRFQLLLREELWRRCFRLHYKALGPDARFDILEKLIYGEGMADNGDDADVDEGTLNGKQAEARFEDWWAVHTDEMGKKKAQAVLRRGAPPFEGLLDLETTFSERQWMPWGVNAELDAQRNALIEDQLSLITRGTAAFDSVLTDAVDDDLRFRMMVQALRYAGPGATDSVDSGAYRCTLDIAAEDIVAPIHARFEANRGDKTRNIIDGKNARITALSIANATTRASFLGRALVAAGTRGGKVFDHLVALLASGTVPLQLFKISCVLVGKCSEGRACFGGKPWVQCPVSMAVRFRDILGEEVFAQVEIKMRSKGVGWTYRASDIPNRHGHCNSNPWSGMVMDFNGFEWPEEDGFLQ